MIAVGRPATHGRVVQAAVDGRPVSFWSHDAELHEAVEAFGTAFLLPALQAARPLTLAGRADRRWRRNLRAAADLACEWWGYAPQRVAVGARLRPGARHAGGRRVLCFTGGVDSLHSLLVAPERPDALLWVRGYDVALHDAERLAAVEGVVRDVAARAGVEALVLTSDLRRHPLFDAVSWDRGHGAALAAAGHVLGSARLQISSSLPDAIAIPWGTHHRLDARWSSTRMRVEHVGGSVDRLRKTWAIGGDPIAREHLRVCWQYELGATNCSHCDKCVVTMIALAVGGDLEHVATFHPPAPLDALVDALPATIYVRTYRELLKNGPSLARGLRRALEDLLTRSA